MNQIERLREDLLRRFPDLDVTIDPPADVERGTWHLDLKRRHATPLVVEWRPDRGFGVSSIEEDDPAFGSGPDEVYPNARAALERLVQLILSGGRSLPPMAVRLAELRQGRGLTQEELAERAGVKQANISRIEGRGDVLVSTLAKVVSAMGGTLSIRARFPDGTERELDFGTTTTPSGVVE
jgi:DNA-binding XRE family transcriptional regulator